MCSFCSPPTPTPPRTASRALENAKWPDELEERVAAGGLCAHLDNDAGTADVDDTAVELLGERNDAAHVVVAHAQGFGGRHWRGSGGRLLHTLCADGGSSIDRGVLRRRRSSRPAACRALPPFRQELWRDVLVVLVPLPLLLLLVGATTGCRAKLALLKVLWPQDADLDEHELALNDTRLRVVQHGPDGHEVLKLPARLLHNTVLAAEHDAHATQVADLGRTHDEAVDVEAARSQRARDARENTRLVLHERVENVPLDGLLGGRRSVVQNVGHGLAGVHCRWLEGRQGRQLAQAVFQLIVHGR